MSAYQQGREARRNGVDHKANPFTFGPDQAMWFEGWRDSDAILRAMEPFQTVREG